MCVNYPRPGGGYTEQNRRKSAFLALSAKKGGTER